MTDKGLIGALRYLAGEKALPWSAAVDWREASAAGRPAAA